MGIGIVSLLVLVVVAVIAIPILARVMGEAARQDEDHSGDFPEDKNEQEDESREDESREGERNNRYGDVRDFEKE